MNHVSRNRLSYAALAATIVVAAASPSSAHHASYASKGAGRYIVTVDVKKVPRRKKRYTYSSYKKKAWRKAKTYKRWRPAEDCNW